MITHDLSSKWTVVYFIMVVAILIIELVAMAFATWIGSFIVIGILALFCFFCRNVRIVRYDDHFLYVRSFFKSEAISLAEVQSVNIPDAWGDRIFQVELRSGRIIEFIPSFEPSLFIWQKSGVPDNVRRFQTFLTNFERRPAS